MNAGLRILVHESDPKARAGILGCLSEAGYDVREWNGADALQASVREGGIDLAIIGVAADGADLELLDSLGACRPGIPAIIVTAAEAVDLRILGLGKGAMDYVVRPVRGDDLLARISTAMARRVAIAAENARRLVVGGDALPGPLADGASLVVLTPSERQAFSLLLESRDRPVSKSRLKSALAEGRKVTDNAVEVTIHRLRAKARGFGLRIRTCRGTGYLLEHA